MKFQSRDNSGALFRADNEKTDRSPDYTGTITIGGRDFRLSVWLKTSEKGKYMSLAATPKADSFCSL